MSRITYVNGRYHLHQKSCIHIDDRGYQFSDGVYEVCYVNRGFIIDLSGHLNRLERSLKELSIRHPVQRSSLKHIIAEVVRRNLVYHGLVYIQITRGVAQRNHFFPSKDISPSLIVAARKTNPEIYSLNAANGLYVITVPENRWSRVDIKSISLLPNVLARQEAKKKGAQEAWFLDEKGYVTEGAATNAWIVTPKGILVTRSVQDKILNGITRKTLIDVSKKLNIKVEERPFTLEEALSSSEAFMTASTLVVMPVVKINDSPISNGKSGSITLSLRNLFFDVAEKTPVW